MRLPRQHEQTQACRPTDPGRQASPARSGGTRSLTVAALAAAVLASGAAPALAQPTGQTRPAAATASPGAPDRIHQALSSSVREKAIRAAESQKGTPYAWGGSGPDSFDCSGLVQWSFKQAGVSLPRIAHDQVQKGTKVSYADARRGDLLYWSDGGYAYHVAIYLGRDRMIDAPSSGDHVRERDVNKYNLAGAVRL